MAADLGEIAERLFQGIMAPLVLGGPLRPGHAIGARAAFALGQGEQRPTLPDLEARVYLGRVRRARALAPVDTVGAVTPAEWRLAAMLHDLLQVANPAFDSALRRSAASRILEVAHEGIEGIPPPAHVREALERHSLFARVLEITRTDTAVSWWIGSRTYLGADPPARLRAWPDLRRVTVVATPHPLLEVAPLAVDRHRLADALTRWLARTPLTDFATCSRAAPPFAWADASIAFVATYPGRTLALRALARLPAADADAALGRATRDLLALRPGAAAPVLALLADRALAEAQGHVETTRAELATPTRPEIALARGLGAAEALRRLEASGRDLPAQEYERITAALREAARARAAAQAVSMLTEGLRSSHELK
jgi:hypothetical protein